MEADPIALLRQALDRPYREYTVWRRNPTHCGLWIHHARTIFHREGAKYAATPGASATNWASGKRNTKIKETKANVRQMKFKGPVSSWMASRIATEGDQRAMTAETIENAIEEGERHHSSLASVAPTIRRQTHVIQKLATALQAEAPEITFDYFTMHDLC
ncbi:hypothetical protein B0T12DRAFT_480017 [Alternaria alternata]|nr:hypothetical protein B0T12DRAFT_480017 [Alternaria alternata]